MAVQGTFIIGAMLVILGYIACLGCIFGVYVVHGGNVSVILTALPFEMITIMGGALGAFVVNNQPKVLKATMKALPMALKGSKYTKARYMELMAMLYDILQKARKEGLMAIESDVESPQDSEIFKKYPTVGSDHHVIEFMTDYLRMMVSGNLNAHEIESLMDSEIETHHQEAHAPVAALARLAGAGIPLLSQTVLLRGVNADADTLADLFRALIRNRVKPYYLHHCDLARGTSHFRTSIAEGQAIMADLRGRISGTCLPQYVLDLPGGHGKVPLGPGYLHETAPGRWLIRDWQGMTHHYRDPEA